MAHMSKDGEKARIEGYCNQCDASVVLYRTPPWQDDVCAQCSSTDVTSVE